MVHNEKEKGGKVKKEKMKAKKGKDGGGEKKAIMDIVLLLTVIMVSSVFSVMTQLTTGSDATRTMVRNGYVVNPDNVTISIDGNTTSVLIGQNVQFMCGGNKTGTVTIIGIAPEEIEGLTFTSNSTGWFDTGVMTKAGMYNATYGEHWELLAVSKPGMGLSLKAGTKDVSSICSGAPLRVHLETNLDKNDCVDLVVRTPEGYLLTQNPADPNQKFDDINVSQLLEYGSENESKQINTTGWNVGTYTFSVRTEEENARGLDVCSKETELAVLSVEITIEAEKCVVVESEKLRLTVTGAPKHNIAISSSDPTHTIFPAGYEDNPPFDTSGFNDTIDEDGKRKYVVYFNDTGTYTIEVTDTTAGLSDYDRVDISVSEKMVSFDVPSTVVIGEAFTIKGTANTSNTVDIAVEDYVYPELDDIPIEENGEFETEIDTGTTNITPFTVPGTVLLEAYIDRAAGAGETGANETEDGSAAILMVRAGLTAELSTDSVARGGNFMVNGTAGGVGNVDMVVVAPKGSNGSMICPTGTPLRAGTNIYYAVVPVTAECTFTKKICVGTDVDTGSYLVVVLSKGRDGGYGRGYNNLTEALADYSLTGKTQAQILAILEDATAGAAGSDDLMWIEYINVIPGLNVSISKNAVSPGDSFEVYGNASSDYVEVVAISPRGGYGIGLDGLYGVSIYTIPTFMAIDTFSDREIAIKEKGDGVGANAPTTGKIVFDMSSTCIIGENVAVKGSASEGESVDIAMDDIVKAVDIPIENGTFYTEISTAGYSPGSYTIEGFIDGNYSVGEDVSGEESDGTTLIRLIEPGLTANISMNVTAPGGSFVINGTATGTDHVDIITISPKGGGGAGLYEESYPGVPGITNESIPVENNSFSKTIDVSEDADAGRYVIWVSVPGRDGCYGNWNDVNNASELVKQIIDDYFGGDADGLRTKKQEQILAILEDATISKAGSDDLACIMELTVGHPSYNNFYKRIKVDSSADTGNYTILVLSPGIDGVYGDSSYKYIDSILDLDGAGPELGAMDVSNKTKGEIVRIIEDATVNAAGSDDLIWMGNITVSNEDYIDTGSPSNPYPSISGTHNGTIIPSHDINVSKLYTYPCPGTGGHTEYARIWNSSGLDVNATWEGYAGDWKNITFDKPVILMTGKTYNYTIRTGSYPQIIHNQTHTTLDGSFINCTEFIDANGKKYEDWIPAIKLYS